ncbi:MAG TPA: carboxypeptidase regulatory-like domain-containing protein [Pyrinomonadaceae bacterium]|nr:carboxypeptidase regulatory-like domain-containing protein [Pyrinomonadaceae bacterium]
MKRLTIILTFAALLCLPLFIAYAAGGSIEGKVTDPKGAVVVGAHVSVTNKSSKQTATTITDAQGNYKIEALLAGTYTVTVSAKGFNDSTRDDVAVKDETTISVDLKLVIASLEAQVKVTSQKGNQDPVYQQLRQLGKTDQDFAGPYATVNSLTLQRDAASFTLRSGEVYFVAPVEGRVTAAVFIGDGVLDLTPPTNTEKRSLKTFTGEDKISEQFSRLVMRFSDNTFEEIKTSTSASMKTGGPAASQARDAFRDNQQLLRKRLRDNRELRTLFDFYGQNHPGYFNTFIDGKHFNKLVFTIDPLGVPGALPEEVSLRSYGDSDWGVWTAFHRQDEYKNGVAVSSEDHRVIDILRHEIDGAIKGTHIAATDRITFRALGEGNRVIPFELFGSLRVTRVQDEEGNDLSFIQEDKDEDSDFGVILTKPLESSKTYKLTVQYDGNDALRDSGGGNFILIPRSTWYPGNANVLFAEDRAIFDMTFRYPKAYTFVGTGAPDGPETREGDLTVSKWTSGPTELAVAGFNYGKFKKKEVADKDTGYNVEFYANEEVPDEIKQIQRMIEMNEQQGMRSMTTLGSISTTSMANSALADAQNATRIYNAFFGKLPYTRIAMTQQPAPNFGQAWPTLVFMPYIAFIDATQRTQLLGTRGGTDNFWKYVAPHEIAHQWWGHVIGWDSYHDQWMSEGFAEFSASLYVQRIRGLDKFLDFWEDKRKDIVQSTPATKDRKPYTVGPVTQGYRLNNGKTGNWIAQSLIYPKGAYILHMLRMMMYETKTGDARFQAMMKDFIQMHFNQDISTEDFKHAVERHMTKEMDVARNGTMDWFFDEWVYGTDVPSYKFSYKIGADGVFNAHLTQSGVSPNFAMPVPIYLDFGKGWVRLGSGTIVGNDTLEIKDLKLPTVPKRATICALNDVLTVDIQSSN